MQAELKFSKFLAAPPASFFPKAFETSRTRIRRREDRRQICTYLPSQFEAVRGLGRNASINIQGGSAVRIYHFSDHSAQAST